MRAVTCLLVALASVSFAWAAASPTTADPGGLIAAQTENQPQVDEAAKVFVKARDLVAELMSKRDQKNYAAIRGETVGEAFALQLKLGRLANRLKTAVEPSGVDLELRAFEMNRRLGQLIQEMKLNAQVRDGLARTFTAKVLPLATKRQQQLPALEKLCKANQWDTAESELYEILDELESYGCWYEAAEREKVFGPFSGATKTINDYLHKQRSDAVSKRLDDLKADPGPKLDAWLQQAAAAAASIAQTGSASIEARQLNGPAAFAHFVRQLLAVEQAAIRLRAVEWSRERVHSRAFPEASALSTLFDQKTAEMLQRLAAFIEADATRAMAGEVDSLYQAYLTEIGNVSGLFAPGALAKAVQPALDKLTAKNPTLAAQIAMYDRATADLMRWRRRIASVQAQARTKDFPPLATKIAPVCLPEGDFPGVLGKAQTLEMLSLTTHAPAIMARLAKVVGANGQVGEARANDAGTHAVTGYQVRLAARLPSVKPALAGYLPLLEYDLLVNPQAPPLSLAAATALAKARRGDVEAAGGAVRQLGLSGLPTRSIQPTAEDLASLRLGALPHETIPDFNPASQLCIECELDPAWIRHELFFIPLK